MNRIELKEKILDERWKKVTLQLWEKITDELVEKVSCELEANVSRELWAITARELNAKMIGELWEKVTCELWEKASRELVEKVSLELGKQVTDELKAKITDELKTKVSRELGKKVSRELVEKASLELWEKASRELGAKASRELGKKIIEEPKEKTSDESKEKISNEPGARKSKTGNDYRSLNKQIDNFLDHLEEEGSPLQWLPLEELSDQQIVELAITFLERSEKDGNRFLYSNMKRSEIMCDYGELVIDDIKRRKSTELMYEIDPMLKEITNNKLKIRDAMKYIEERFKGRLETKFDYKCFALELKIINKNIHKCIEFEKNALKAMGLKATYMGYLEDYIFVVEKMVLGSLLFTIVLNRGVEDKKSSFERINKTIEYLKTSQKNIKETREEIPDISDIMEFYVCFLRRKSWCKEHEKIMKMLQEENEESFKYSENIITLKKTKNSKHIILNNEKKLSESDRKFSDIRKLVRRGRELGNNYVDFPIVCRDILIKEAFISKQIYRKKSAMTIIREINEFGIKDENDNYIMDGRYLMFLDAKFIRGIFGELNILSEYKNYCDIRIAIRELFLSSYELLNQADAYQRICSICSKLLTEIDTIIQELYKWE